METLDEDKFVSEFAEASIKNWKGLNCRALRNFNFNQIQTGKIPLQR